MLPIVAKTNSLKKELHLMMEMARAFLDALDVANRDNLYDTIGKFAREQVGFKILRDEEKMFLELVRRLCTGEMSIETAKEHVTNALEELEVLDARIV